MVEWFVDSQEEDGRWHNSPFLQPNPSEANDLSTTAEFVLHLTTMLTALAGQDRGRRQAS